MIYSLDVGGKKDERKIFQASLENLEVLSFWVGI